MPAYVVTTPSPVILRIVELLASVTYRLPAESTTIPVGFENSAALPVPSWVPRLLGEPATVVTTPAEVILRMVALPVSQTKTEFEASRAIPVGALNKAAVPVPSAEPAAPLFPANTLIVLSEAITLMQLFAVSET